MHRHPKWKPWLDHTRAQRANQETSPRTTSNCRSFWGTVLARNGETARNRPAWVHGWELPLRSRKVDREISASLEPPERTDCETNSVGWLGHVASDAEP